ncbi:HNH endonuclease [Pedobacter sp. L105]|uniref:HNH endonuclease n=1 Tax=Pedobacter sp. L105 TaxID=1641871 RepID=UPI00131CE045|nr:HNH endonuclease [Pedobacter sp. L105]
MKCYSCNNDAGSLEHVINNSIGGEIKSRDLLCNKCNIEFGATIDTELDKRIGYVGDLLGIGKDRGKSAPIIIMKSDSGLIKHVGPFMKPLFKFTFPAGGGIREQFVPEEKSAKFIKKNKQSLPFDSGDFFEIETIGLS